MRFVRLLGTCLTAVCAVAATACDRRSDTEELLSGGEVVGDSGTFYALDYPITSENYKKWLVAQAALDTVDLDLRLRINPRRLTAVDIDRVVSELENEPGVRRAIESSGLNARDYVLTSVALAQSWDAVREPGAHLRGVPAENVEWLRRQAATDPAVQTRWRARILERDSEEDSEDSEDSDRKRRRGRGADSDSDSR